MPDKPEAVELDADKMEMVKLQIDVKRFMAAVEKALRTNGKTWVRLNILVEGGCLKQGNLLQDETLSLDGKGETDVGLHKS